MKPARVAGEPAVGRGRAEVELGAEAVERLAGRSDPLGVRVTQLRASIDALLAYLERHPAAFIAFHRGAFGADPELRAIDEQGHARQVERILAAMTDGEKPPELLRLAIRGWTGFVEATILNWLEAGRPVPREEVADLLVTSLAAIADASGGIR